VSGTDAVVTDTWVQMSEADQLGEGGTRSRHNALARYRVDERLMSAAGKAAIFMHCLPAHRGEEVTDAVLDRPRSVVFNEARTSACAENRACLGDDDSICARDGCTSVSPERFRSQLPTRRYERSGRIVHPTDRRSRASPYLSRRVAGRQEAWR
jgi:hypothetical protein